MSHRSIVLMTFAKGSSRLSWPCVNIMNIKSLFFPDILHMWIPYTVSGLSYMNLYSVYWCETEQGNCCKCHSLNDAIYPPSFTLAHRGHHPAPLPKTTKVGWLWDPDVDVSLKGGISQRPHRSGAHTESPEQSVSTMVWSDTCSGSKRYGEWKGDKLRHVL